MPDVVNKAHARQILFNVHAHMSDKYFLLYVHILHVFRDK